jgi:hypothetical protein
MVDWINEKRISRPLVSSHLFSFSGRETVKEQTSILIFDILIKYCSKKAIYKSLLKENKQKKQLLFTSSVCRFLLGFFSFDLFLKKNANTSS